MTARDDFLGEPVGFVLGLVGFHFVLELGHLLDERDASVDASIDFNFGVAADLHCFVAHSDPLLGCRREQRAAELGRDFRRGLRFA